jgi:hypothetical protein
MDFLTTFYNAAGGHTPMLSPSELHIRLRKFERIFSSKEHINLLPLVSFLLKMPVSTIRFVPGYGTVHHLHQYELMGINQVLQNQNSNWAHVIHTGKLAQFTFCREQLQLQVVFHELEASQLLVDVRSVQLEKGLRVMEHLGFPGGVLDGGVYWSHVAELNANGAPVIL